MKAMTLTISQLRDVVSKGYADHRNSYTYYVKDGGLWSDVSLACLLDIIDEGVFFRPSSEITLIPYAYYCDHNYHILETIEETA